MPSFISLRPSADTIVRSVNGTITKEWESSFTTTDGKSLSLLAMDFTYDKNSFLQEYHHDNTKFRKLETQNITVWNSIDKIDSSFTRFVARILYVASIAVGFPLADWAYGLLRSDHEGRIFMAEGNIKAKDAIAEIAKNYDYTDRNSYRSPVSNLISFGTIDHSRYTTGTLG